MAADGSGQRNLSQHPRSDYSPAWSPDGATIAFASDRDGDPNEIYVMDADGSNQVRVTDNPGIDEYPTWSPDGTRIAFHCTMGGVNSNGTGDFEICVVSRDGSGLHRLTDTPGENTQPDWSPDGEWIVFESNRLGWPSLPTATPAGYDHESFGDEDVWMMRTDGSQQRNLTSNPLEDDSFPAWSPDGTWIVFSRYGQLRIVARAGAEQPATPQQPGHRQLSGLDRLSPTSSVTVSTTQRRSSRLGQRQRQRTSSGPKPPMPHRRRMAQPSLSSENRTADITSAYLDGVVEGRSHRAITSTPNDTDELVVAAPDRHRCVSTIRWSGEVGGCREAPGVLRATAALGISARLADDAGDDVDHGGDDDDAKDVRRCGVGQQEPSKAGC